MTRKSDLEIEAVREALVFLRQRNAFELREAAAKAELAEFQLRFTKEYAATLDLPKIKIGQS